MSEVWDLLRDGDGTGDVQMATDEAMMDIVAETGRPLLRIYRFVPATLSLGRGQRLEEVFLPGADAVGADVVRRPSGGKAVLHDDEVTYALAAPAGLFPQNVTESYRIIARGLLRAAELLGIRAAFSDGAGDGGDLEANCFIHPSFYELTVDGKKCIGSAQVRHRGALLQHGSVPRRLSYERWAACFAPPGPERDRFAQAMAERSRGLFQDEPVPPSYADLGEAIREGMAEAQGVTFAPLEDDGRLRARVEELLASRGYLLRRSRAQSARHRG